MGTYYFLLNDTKKLAMHLCSHIKHGPITQNNAVHYAFVNYMYENQGDTMRLVDDYAYADTLREYQHVDLLQYPYKNKDVLPEIVSQLNHIYGHKKFDIQDGVGVELVHGEQLWITKTIT